MDLVFPLPSRCVSPKPKNGSPPNAPLLRGLVQASRKTPKIVRVRSEIDGKLNGALSGDFDPRFIDRQKALEAAMNDINSSFRKGSVTRLGSAGGALVETFLSGCLTLDFALGGGLPKGRIVEIYGPESSGKTLWPSMQLQKCRSSMCALFLPSVSYHLETHVRSACYYKLLVNPPHIQLEEQPDILLTLDYQRLGGNAMLVEAEHVFDSSYSKSLAVDVENLIVCQPDNGEMALETADHICRSGAVDLICIDSVSALTPRAEIEVELGCNKWVCKRD